MSGRTLTIAAACLSLLALPGCPSGPDCARGDHGGAECRIATSAALASMEIEGFVLAFEPRSGADPYAHTEAGLFRQEDSAVVARVATLGDFEITIDGSGATASTTLVMVLTNVGVGVQVIAEPVDRPTDAVEILAADGELQRGVTLDLAAGESWVIRGTTACATRYRIAAFGDTQTDMDVLQAIVDQLDVERAEAEAAGEPLLGVLLVGDLTDVGTVEEIVDVREMILAGSVPVAATVGNHDVYTDDVDVFNREVGPGNLRFDVCGTRVAILDTGDASLAPSIEGRLTQLLDGAGADRLIVATHYPPYSSRLGNGWSHEDQQATTLAEIALADPDVVLAGHVHNLTEFPEVPVGDRSFHQIVVGTGGGFQGEVTAPRFGYLRLTLGDTFERCFVPVQLSADEPVEPQRDDEPPLCP
jgi:hypothetical protein